MKFPKFLKRSPKVVEPTESDKMRDALHVQLDKTNGRLDEVLIRLRKVREMAVMEPARLRLVKK